MALRPIEVDRSPRERIDSELFSGWVHRRRYQCPVGSLDTDLATLALGRVLPAAEGGDGGSTAEEPRLASTTVAREKADGLHTYIDAIYIEVDVTSAEYSGTFKETTKSGSITNGQFESRKRIVGICTATDDAGIPARGLTLAGAAPDALTDYVCRNIEIIEKWQGRVLVIAEFARPIGYSE